MVTRANIEEGARLARVRLDHVSLKGQSLADSITAYMATKPIRGKIHIAEDRLSWEMIWSVATPPLESWALTFGDATHNLRAMLDNCLHFIAETEGVSKRLRKNVQFPIVTDADNWAAQDWHISMLPPRVQGMLKALQPFNRPEHERKGDGMALLSAFNNADKHRIILTAIMQTHELGHQFSVEFEDGASDGGPPRTIFNAEVADGAVGVHHDTSPDRIKNVEGKANFTGQIVVTDDDGLTYGITSALASLSTYVSTVLEQVLTVWESDEPFTPTAPPTAP